MKLLLTHKDLESTIEPDSRSDAELRARSEDQKKKRSVTQKKALALIGLKVEEEFLGVIEDAEDSARKAWIAFEGDVPKRHEWEEADAQAKAGNA